MDDFNASIIEEFRANHGKVGGMFDGARLLLLHTTGAKSGKDRIAPLAYRKEGDDLVVFASKAGAPTHPDWYHNLVANPKVTVEVGDETFEATARITEGAEREEIWERQKAEINNFAQYEKNTERQIPVIVLERG